MTEAVLACFGGRCDGHRARVVDEIGTRCRVTNERGDQDWYIVVRDAYGRHLLLHDDLDRAIHTPPYRP